MPSVDYIDSFEEQKISSKNNNFNNNSNSNNNLNNNNNNRNFNKSSNKKIKKKEKFDFSEINNIRNVSYYNIASEDTFYNNNKNNKSNKTKNTTNGNNSIGNNTNNYKTEEDDNDDDVLPFLDLLVASLSAEECEFVCGSVEMVISDWLLEFCSNVAKNEPITKKDEL